MNKQLLLDELNRMITGGEITREEVIESLGIVRSETLTTHVPLEERRHFSVTTMLYVLGGGIVLVGILIFMAQVWEDMGSLMRIVVTFGLGTLLAALGSVLLRQPSEAKVGVIFHVLGGLLVPFGALVSINELGLQTDWMTAVTFGVVFASYFFLASYHRHVVLTLFALANGTATVYLLTQALFAPVLGYQELDVLFQYLTMMLGVSYILAGRYFVGGWNNRLVGVLYLFGVTGLLGAGFVRVLEENPWELLYFLIVFCCLILSVYMKSRAILIMSTLFLLMHVTYITSEYFADSLGWPIVLVILGFIFIGLGYVSFAINNKYIK